MEYYWDPEGVAQVLLRVRDYKGVTLEALKPIIEEIREKSKAMIITADLRNVGFLGLDRLRSISFLICDLLEYTKDDNLLQKIEIIGAGFIFRMVCRSISRELRDLLVFI